MKINCRLEHVYQDCDERLPQEFVDFVMSGAGDEFARTHIPYARSWFETVESNYGDEPHANFLPQDAGNTTLDNL